MNRIIKFKAKRLDNGEWAKGDLLHKGNKTYIYNPRINDKGFYMENEEVDPSTVCQYTGMHDKAGTPIWEGDIVEETWSIFNDHYEVVYIPKEGAFAFKRKLYGKEDIQPYSNIMEFISLGSKFDRKEGEK